jgi:hypothetical protein
MLIKWSKKPIIIVLLSFIVLSGIIFFPLIYSLSDKLSKTTRVNANVLIVEGWLPPYALEMAYSEFQKNDYNYIFSTGLKYTDEYFNISENGYLIFYVKDKLIPVTKPGIHIIEIDSYSELGGEQSAHFNLWINDSLVADFLAEKKKRKYSFTWEGSLSAIDSVMVQFTNDGVGDYGDRNLYVKSLVFDNQIEIPFLYNSVYDVGKIDGIRRTVNNINSNAERTAKNLISMGIDSNLIIAIPGKRVRINRTLTSALAFRDWLKKSDIKVEGINILSSGTHSMRTWMTFNKVLDKSYNIGIISLPDYKIQRSRRQKVLKTLRETIGLIYYWIILIPY